MRSQSHRFAKLPLLCTLSTCILTGLANEPAAANDTSVSLAAGGIQPRREARVSMEKERLVIGEKKIRVEYEFLNESDAAVTTDVAFPIPPVNCINEEFCPGNLFDDFSAYVDGKKIELSVDIKALVNGRDYAALLQKYKIDIADFGHYDPLFEGNLNEKYDVAKLSKEQQRELINLGIIENSAALQPLWTVEKAYYWTQTFPAHRKVQVVHEYIPVLGSQRVEVENLDPDLYKTRLNSALKKSASDTEARSDIFQLTPINDSCIDSDLQEMLEKRVDPKPPNALPDVPWPKYVEMYWVNYILTTANSWKTPIKDFTLEVERPATDTAKPWYVSFCWEGKVRRVDSSHFVARAENFVPKRELTIVFVRNVSDTH